MKDDTAARVDFAGIQALSTRPAGYAVAAKCLEVQSLAEAQDPTLRTDSRVTLHGDAWSWYTGALGEIRVGEMLNALGPEWFVRHAVPIGAGTKDVDHLVIGPGGVFSINTKHHAGASIWVGDFVLRVNNANTHHLKQAISDGADAERRLAVKLGFPVTATPVLALLNPKSIVDRRAPDSRLVSVIAADGLVAWLRSRPRQFSDTELALIRIAAEEPETWHIDPRAADTFRVMQRFERLAAQVGAPKPPATSPVTDNKSRPEPRKRPSRRPTERVPRLSASTSKGRSKGRTSVKVVDLMSLWFSVGLVVTGFLVFRGYANQPCATPVECMIPVLYASLKPLLTIVVLAIVGMGAIGTLMWAVRRSRR
jgi:hypothetical protein